MAAYAGFVAKIGLRESPPGSRRKWKLYSVKLAKPDGEEYPWISLGFRDDPPPIKDGDYITLEANESEGRLNYVEGSVRKPKNPPARTGGNSQGSNRAGGSQNGGANRRGYSGPAANKFDGSGIQNRSNPEDVKRMSYANSRTEAINVISLLLANDALPVSSAKTKAGESKRYEEILKSIDKMTVRFYNDAMTLRRLVTVADEGEVDTGADGDLPPADDGKGHPIDQDDAPPAAEEDDASPEPGDNDDDEVAF